MTQTWLRPDSDLPDPHLTFTWPSPDLDLDPSLTKMEARALHLWVTQDAVTPITSMLTKTLSQKISSLSTLSLVSRCTLPFQNFQKVWGQMTSVTSWHTWKHSLPSTISQGWGKFKPMIADERSFFLAPSGAQGVTMSVCVSVWHRFV